MFFAGIYNFVFKYSIDISVNTKYGFKLGSIKVTDLGFLVNDNYGFVDLGNDGSKRESAVMCRLWYGVRIVFFE